MIANQTWNVQDDGRWIWLLVLVVVLVLMELGPRMMRKYKRDRQNNTQKQPWRKGRL